MVCIAVLSQQGCARVLESGGAEQIGRFILAAKLAGSRRHPRETEDLPPHPAMASVATGVQSYLISLVLHRRATDRQKDRQSSTSVLCSQLLLVGISSISVYRMIVANLHR